MHWIYYKRKFTFESGLLFIDFYHPQDIEFVILSIFILFVEFSLQHLVLRVILKG